VSRLGESLDIIDRLLSGETVDAPGSHYRARGADVFPRPVQKPRPPIMVAASGPRMLAMAGRKADIITFGVGPQEGDAGFRERIATVREGAGGRFDDIELSLNLVAVAGRMHPIFARSGMTAERLAATGAPAALMGSTDEMVEHLQRVRERLGISYVTIWDEFIEDLAPVVERLTGS
jgi:alkanesulfonate monooxygenase SsuD/methylene tetrahydromethanopterin reductase-like flavin-dependent oxidoreductase (luciferase family)